MKTTVTLDAGEQQVARVLAKLRHNNNREAGITNGKIGPQSNRETDLNGIGGELAFCKMCNLWPYLSVSPRRGGADCYSYKGNGIDVKTTKYSSGKLLARVTKDIDDVDIYVLVIGEMPTYRWVGWATTEELLREENITDLGHGPTYAMEQSILRLPNGV